MATKLNFKDFTGTTREDSDSWFGVTGRFYWNFSNPKIIERKGIGRELNKFAAQTIAVYTNEFTPYLTGRLSRNVQVYGAKDHATISYKAPYAAKHYYGTEFDPNRNRTVHPLATSYWDKAAWSVYKREILKEVDAERKRLSYD